MKAAGIVVSARACPTANGVLSRHYPQRIFAEPTLTEVTMSKRTSREGARVPDVELAELRDGNVKRMSSLELFRGRRVILLQFNWAAC